MKRKGLGRFLKKPFLRGLLPSSDSANVEKLQSTASDAESVASSVRSNRHEIQVAKHSPEMYVVPAGDDSFDAY